MKKSVLAALRRKSSQVYIILLALVILSAWLAVFFPAVQASARESFQQPTVAVATVTGTPSGPVVTVPQDQLMIYVHTGPSQDYPVIGILVSGEKAPALGISPDGQWVKVVYRGVPDDVGWVYVRLVILDEILPAAEVPPTPTAKVTATLDPTMAARFDVSFAPTTAPTYTPPPPLAVPTFAPTETGNPVARLPFGFIIIGLAVVGAFGVALSFLRGR